MRIQGTLKAFMSDTWHEPENIPNRIIFASMFNDITNWERRKVQDECKAQAKEVATYEERLGLGYWCFCGSASEKTLTYHEERPSHQFADGGWDNLALRMINEFFMSKHQCSTVRTFFKQVNFEIEHEIHVILVIMMLACDQLCLFPSSK